MPIGNIIKKASNFILGEERSDEKIDIAYEDNEILFCKNNVCIHPPTVARQESDILHYPGYLTCTTKTFIDQYNSAKRPTLLLTWIPNTSLCKCNSTTTDGEAIHNRNHDMLPTNGHFSPTSQVAVPAPRLIDEQEHEMGTRAEEENAAEMQELKNELQPLLGGQTASIGDLAALLKKNPITSVNITISNPQIENSNISQSYNCIIASPDSEGSNAAVLGRANQPTHQLNSDGSVSDDNNPNWMTPELLAFKHNLVFPESANATPTVRRKAVIRGRRFSVDLSQMRSLRLFFNDDKCTSGQLVIASRESQYKILHFHYGGLDHLAQVLHQWHCFLHNITLAPGQEKMNLPYRHFMVCRPEVKQSEMHPDEGNVKRITTNFFYGTLLNEKGQIEDDLLLRKCVFFGGLEKSLRKTVWPFILKCYSFSSTFEDRAVLMDIKRQEYDEITRKRLYSMSPEQQVQFWRTVQCVVEKDVVRTDRTNPFFCGEDNPNTEMMKNILLNFAIYNTSISYSQGMSDLLAPVLCEVQNESETFWCFVGLMQRAFFVCTPTDNDVDHNLSYLRELIRLMLPRFYEHLERHNEAMELLFCHRWLLLCFKREFTEAVVIRMWEACWSNYLTDYFHLFLCLAIIAVYADDVIAQNLRADEMLLHFSSLAMYMDGQLILRKARGLLYQYRQLPKIPCTLSGLCKRCGPGMWDSEHRPALECVGHTDNEKCSLGID
ncbi:TBC1 domain family member 16 [Drosophila novamexicana]|uniref:TBC1 domain family member 16 n=1 Tax=Drosophila novamexicana TaxID=47314 RepID=UPI0011E5C7EC|nr:TBC1 domain family member 16 [Drosophila novamexicana]